MFTEAKVLAVSRWVLFGVAIMGIVIAVPLIRGSVAPNAVYGFRTAKTLSDPAIWYAANSYMGWCLAAAGAVSAALIALRPAQWRWGPLFDILSLVVPLVAATIASMMYFDSLT
jgi:hypothetical protein